MTSDKDPKATKRRLRYINLKSSQKRQIDWRIQHSWNQQSPQQKYLLLKSDASNCSSTRKWEPSLTAETHLRSTTENTAFRSEPMRNLSDLRLGEEWHILGESWVVIFRFAVWGVPAGEWRTIPSERDECGGDMHAIVGPTTDRNFFHFI